MCCWRDDVEDTRLCSACGQYYYGSLGHVGCPARKVVSDKDLDGVPKVILKKALQEVAKTLGSTAKAKRWLLTYNRALSSFPFQVLLEKGGETRVMQVLGRISHGVVE